MVSHEQGNLCLVAQLCPILCDPMDYSPPCSSVHEDSPGQNTGVGCQALLQGDLPNPGIQHRSPTLQTDSLLSKPPGKPKNTGVGRPIPFLRNLPDPGIELGSPALQADSLPAELPGKAWNLAGPIDHPTVGNFPTSAALTQFMCGRIEDIYGQGRHLLLAGGTPQALNCHSAPHPLLGFLSLKLIWFL